MHTERKRFCYAHLKGQVTTVSTEAVLHSQLWLTMTVFIILLIQWGNQPKKIGFELLHSYLLGYNFTFLAPSKKLKYKRKKKIESQRLLASFKYLLNILFCHLEKIKWRSSLLQQRYTYVYKYLPPLSNFNYLSPSKFLWCELQYGKLVRDELLELFI